MHYFTPDEVIFELLLLKELAKKSQSHEEIHTIRKDFSEIAHSFQDQIILDIERLFDVNNNMFCVMAPVGGPWYINKESSVHVKKWLPSCFEVIFECYIGHLSIWENKCGIDNLKILSEGHSDV